MLGEHRLIGVRIDDFNDPTYGTVAGGFSNSQKLANNPLPTTTSAPGSLLGTNRNASGMLPPSGTFTEPIYTNTKTPLQTNSGFLTASEGLYDNYNPQGSPSPASPGPAETPDLNKAQSEGFQDVAGYNAYLRGALPGSIASDLASQGYIDPNTIARKNGEGDQDFAIRKSDAIRNNANLLERQKQAQYEKAFLKEKEKPTQVASGAGIEGKAAPVEPPKAQGQTAVTLMLSGMGPEGAALAAAMESQNAENQRAQTEVTTETQAALTKTEQGFNDVKSQLEQMKTDAAQNRDLIQDLLQDISDDNQDYISQQQKAADERLQWEATKQQRTLAKQKVDQNESMIVQSALFGGFGQDATIRSINESDNAFEDKIREVQTELGYARTDLAVKFTGLYLENKNQLREGLLENFKSMQAQLTSINLQGISNTQAKNAAEERIIQAGWQANQTLRKESSANQLAQVKEMVKAIYDEKKMKSDAQADALTTVMDLFTKFPAGSKERQSSIDMYKAAGGKIDFNAKTQTIEELNEAADGAGNSFLSTNVGKFRDAETGDDLAVAISSVVTGKGIATADERTGRINDLMFLLQGGEDTREEFNQLLMNTAYLSLDTSARGEVDSKTQVGDGIQKVIDKIGSLTPEQLARVDFWAKKTKGIKNAADLPNDPEFIKLVSDITYPMASLRKELFGSALTDSELAFSDVFLANPMGEDLQDSLSKLQSISENMENDITNLYAPRLGSKKLYEKLKEGGVVPTSSPNVSNWNMSIENSINGNVEGDITIPEENEPLKTGFLSGTVTGYGSKYWDAGVDIAAPKNTPIVTPIGGVLENFVYNSDWKGTPNNSEVGKSENGGFGNQATLRYPDGVKIQISHASKIPFGKDMIGKQIDPGTIVAYVGNTGNTYGKTGIHADITGYRSDGSLMTAKEVTEWMLRNSRQTVI